MGRTLSLDGDATIENLNDLADKENEKAARLLVDLDNHRYLLHTDTKAWTQMLYECYSSQGKAQGYRAVARNFQAMTDRQNPKGVTAA